MRLRIPHVPYVARKIALDISKSDFIDMEATLEDVEVAAKEILDIDIKKEMALEEEVNEIMDDNEDDMEFMRVDRKNLFWLIKKRLATESGFIMAFDDRYSNIAHQILDKMYENDLIHYVVTDNKVKNVIFGSISDYLKDFNDIEDVVIDKIDHYKKKLVPGSSEYEIVFEKLYQEELSKRGMY